MEAFIKVVKFLIALIVVAILAGCSSIPKLVFLDLKDNDTQTRNEFRVYLENLTTDTTTFYTRNGQNRGAIINGMLVSEDGNYRFVINQGSNNIVDRKVKLDRQPPFVKDLKNNGTYSYGTRITVQDQLSEVASIEIIDEMGEIISNQNNYNLNSIGRFIIRANDELGNFSESVINIATLQGPMVNSEAKFENGLYLAKDKITLNIISSFDLKIHEYTHNQKQPVNLDLRKGEWELTFEVEGIYEYKLVDTNNITKVIKFAIDRTAPTLNIDNYKVYNETVRLEYEELYSLPVKVSVISGGVKNVIDIEKAIFTDNGNYIIEIEDYVGNLATYYLKINIFNLNDILILSGVAITMIFLAIASILIEEKIKNK
jgi:hypothetical protein